LQSNSQNLVQLLSAITWSYKLHIYHTMVHNDFNTWKQQLFSFEAERDASNEKLRKQAYQRKFDPVLIHSQINQPTIHIRLPFTYDLFAGGFHVNVLFPVFIIYLFLFFFSAYILSLTLYATMFLLSLITLSLAPNFL